MCARGYAALLWVTFLLHRARVCAAGARDAFGGSPRLPPLLREQQVRRRRRQSLYRRVCDAEKCLAVVRRRQSAWLARPGADVARCRNGARAFDLALVRPRRRLANAAFASNVVVTSKYTALNFVPLFLFHQFTRYGRGVRRGAGPLQASAGACD